MNGLNFVGAMLLSAIAIPAFAVTDLEKKMLAHVERIVVVDSLTVPKDDFFRNYRLYPSTGRILSGDEVAASLKATAFPKDFGGSPLTGFTNEFNDYLVWAQEDTTGYLRLAQSYRLIGDKWSEPEFTPPLLNFGTDDFDEEEPVQANAAFPFMLDDGQTLYFASDNELSLGGYDIFVATKEPSTGEFLIPSNVGMPFNSPYDDYLLVHDSEAGAGWWATDRNQLEDDITIYIYILSDEPVNVDRSDENLLSYATLSGWQELQDEEEQALARKMREQISRIREPERRNPDFLLPMPAGKSYRFFSDFRSPAAANMMRSYLRDSDAIASKRQKLSALRLQYNDTRNRQLVPRIEALEKELRADESALKRLLSDIYKSETN